MNTFFAWSIPLSYIVFSFNFLIAQEKIEIKPKYNDQDLILGKNYFFKDSKDSFKIETLKFYLSNFSFWANGLLVSKSSNKPCLVDFEKGLKNTLSIDVPQNISFNKIKFNLGIDSLTNVSGAMEGDLDPTKGMYWTWQSGYINLKLEGIGSNCQGRDNKFHYHLGGYLYPYYGLREIEIYVPSTKRIEIVFDLTHFFDQINIENNYQVMSPNKKAMSIADEVAKLFYLEQ